MDSQSANQVVDRMLTQAISLDRFAGKFTPLARKALSCANEEAALLNHNFIGTEHLLLGLLRVEEGIAGIVLKELGVTLPAVRAVIEQMIGRGEPENADAERGLTPRAVTVVLMSVSEAWRVSYIGTEHLLLALLHEGEGIAAVALEQLGVTLSQARMKTFQAIVNRGLVPDAVAGPSLKEEVQKGRGNVVTCRIDNQDLDAIDALVEVGVRSTRSDAAAWLIHAGIEANQAILENIYAVVSEIRAMRTKAQALAQGMIDAQVRARKEREPLTKGQEMAMDEKEEH